MDDKTIQLPWEGEYGPDGPWQAIKLGVGTITDGYDRVIRVPTAMMWPDCRVTCKVLTPALGGEYTATNSSFVIPTPDAMITNADDTEPMGKVIHEDWSGSRVFDVLMLDNKMGHRFPVNASLDVVEKWEYNLPNGGEFFSAPVGTLGLGEPYSYAQGPPPGILQVLKAENSISSILFGLHIGSVALGQPASMVLGGYEQNRALGSVAVFKFKPGSTLPTFYLLDVLLGTQLGTSPFANPDRDEGSVWQGIRDNPGDIAEERTEELGLKPGTALVIPDATVPYIYLPPGTCEAAARRLPVTWDDRLGLYLWNIDDPAYQRIVLSPAYLSFVFADRTATNITIKVPFRLLNLTLEPPLVRTPTPYFPCKPLNSTTGAWVLGRAFLQAAFFGVHFEQNATFLAQAPGPALVQRVVRSLGPGDATLQTNPIQQFEESWLSSWTVLSSSSTSAEPSAEPSSGGDGVLSTGPVVGIVVGAIAMLVASIATLWFFWRRKAKQKQTRSLPSGAEINREWAGSPREQPEMDGQGNVPELGKPNDHELYTPPVVHELPIDWNLPERQEHAR